MPPRRTRALVVEDDPDQRLLVSMLLKHNGVEVISVEDGFHALEAVAAAPPDVIVLDLNLPLVDGRDVLADLRQQSLATPVVVVSGAPDARERAQALGANAVVAKPFDVADLLATVEAVLPAPSFLPNRAGQIVGNGQ